jgi:hypothetical protein
LGWVIELDDWGVVIAPTVKPRGKKKRSPTGQVGEVKRDLYRLRYSSFSSRPRCTASARLCTSSLL